MLKLYNQTPLLHSHPLSNLLGRSIYLKCESLQPSGSFKDRGIGNLCLHYAKQKAKGFVSSSGGNAGLAVAFASQALHLQAKVVVPKVTPQMMIKKLQAEKAEVIVTGEDWNAADKIAQEISEKEGYAYIPPFNNPLIWEGYTSMIREIQQDKIKPEAILLSVGGGGLLSGVCQGLHEIGWEDVAVITAETEGAASLATSVKAGKRIKLEHMHTVAVTLAAKQICEKAFEWTQKHPVFPQTVTDKEAVEACLHYAEDHRQLVEPACGAALAVLYQQREIVKQFSSIVVIICGGSGVNLALLEKWKKDFNI
jgi:L-serine/L-threonine ammonia-lyase